MRWSWNTSKDLQLMTKKILADGYDMGEIDVMEVKMDLMEVMKENKTSMPQGLTMLERHVVIGL